MKKFLASAVFAATLLPGAAFAACADMTTNAVPSGAIVMQHITSQIGTRSSVGGNWRTFGAKIVRNDIGITQFCDRDNVWYRPNTSNPSAEVTPAELNVTCNTGQGTLVGGKACGTCISAGGEIWKIKEEDEDAGTPAEWICKSNASSCWAGWTEYSDAGLYLDTPIGTLGDCGGNTCVTEGGWSLDRPSCEYELDQWQPDGLCDATVTQTGYAALVRPACQ